MSAAAPPLGRTRELIAAWQAQGRGEETIRRWLGLSRREAAMMGLGKLPAEAGAEAGEDAAAKPAVPDSARLRALVRHVCLEEGVPVRALRGAVRDDPDAARAQALICLLGQDAGLTSPRIGAFLRRSPAAIRVTAQRTRAKVASDGELYDACRRLRRTLPGHLQPRPRDRRRA